MKIPPRPAWASSSQATNLPGRSSTVRAAYRAVGTITSATTTTSTAAAPPGSSAKLTPRPGSQGWRNSAAPGRNSEATNVATVLARAAAVTAPRRPPAREASPAPTTGTMMGSSAVI